MFFSMLFGISSNNSGTIVVTTAAPGGSTFGASNGVVQGSSVFGTISNPQNLSPGGSIIGQFDSSPGVDFELLTDSGVAAGQGAFTQLVVDLDAGGTRTLTSASATYSFGGANRKNSWKWGTGSSPVWTSGGHTRNVAMS